MKCYDKKHIYTLFILITLIVSILLFNTSKKTPLSGYRSDDLKMVVTRDGDITQTDYVDSEGKTCLAVNLGYATRIVAKEEDREWEYYLDEKGIKVSMATGFYGILRDYDEEGNVFRITYLDDHNEPVITSEGYSIEEREYNEKKQQIARKYFDTLGQPVKTKSYGYGRLIKYDEHGNAYRIIYVDQNGQPMSTAAGYAIIEREFYLEDGPEKGRVKKEFYYDSDGSPIALSLGQYGVYREYDENGQSSLVTYLDTLGNPIATNKGFTTLAYTYHADNSVATVMYYDINGAPFQMPEGQYGSQNENGQVTYLNADGHMILNLKNIVYNDSRMIVFIAISAVIFSSITGNKINWLLLIACIGTIIYFTLMFRESRESELGIFYSYRRFFISADARLDILRNIWLFVPLGAILYRLYPHYSILFIPFLLSISIEATQYFNGIGICEIDDVISNGLGGFIGYSMSSIMEVVKKRLIIKSPPPK